MGTPPRTLLLSPEAIAPADLPRVGGKARGLYHLTRGGIPVPPWRVLTVDAFEEALAPVAAAIEEAIGAHDLASLTGSSAAHFAVRPLLTRVTIVDTVHDALARAWADLGAGPLVVRSSATQEDDSERSLSGILDSVLDVTDPAALGRAVVTVWRSAYSPHALYARVRFTQGRPLALAVVLQRQVRPRASGIAHTVDVASGRLDTVALDLVAGAGEALAHGHAEPTTLHLPRPSPGAHGPASRVGPPAAARPASPDPLPAGLGEDDLTRLLSKLWAVEAIFGTPQDVEFALEGDRPWILQSRPICGIDPEMAVDPRAPGVTIFDNSNIAESYAGPIKPLTFSFLRRSYASVYREAGEVLGLDPEDVRANEEAYQHLLGYVRGHVYYNLRSWYQLALQLPGGERNARHMEAMMGVSESLPWATTRPPGALKRLLHAMRLLGLLRRAPRLVADFRAHFERIHAGVRRRLGETLGLADLARLYRDLEADLRGRWAAPILADVFAMGFFGAVNDMARQHGLDTEGPIANDLLAGDLHSHATDPIRALADLAAEVARRPDWRAAIEPPPGIAPDNASIHERILRDPALASLRDALEAHLDRYGDRFAGELRLDEPSLRDDPRWLLGVLRGHLCTRRAASSSQTQARRCAALERVRRTLPVVSRALFYWCLAGARRFIAFRETMRLDRSRLFGLVRDILQTMGHRLHAAGRLDAPGDLHFLAVDEVLGFVEGTATERDLAALARVRRFEWAHDRLLAAPPDRLATLGAVGLWVPIRPRAVAAAPGSPPAPDDLAGTPCSPGVVTAPVIVVDDPHRAPPLAGCILVARSNDPGWVPLYAGIAGLLLERGSALSHPANIAREMGIPAIVGIRGLTSRIRTGMNVRMDGRLGRVAVVAEGTQDRSTTALADGA